MVQAARQNIPLVSGFLSASSTGTWSNTIPTTSAKGFWAKTTVAENGIATIPFSVNGVKYLSYGARILNIVMPIEVRTADLTGVITASLTKFDTWMATARPTQTFTVTVGTQLLTVATTALPVGTPVQLTTGTTLPAGLLTSTTYYVGNVSGLTCQLFTTEAQAFASVSPVAFTDTGTGTHNILPNAVVATNIPVTLTGTQVTAGNFIRRLTIVVNTPAYENLTTNSGLKDTVDYVLIVTVPTAAGTVLRLYDPVVEYEAPYHV